MARLMSSHHLLANPHPDAKCIIPGHKHLLIECDNLSGSIQYE